MTCLEIQGQITPFINGELNLKQLEVFLEHINHCEECKEELEVYYTLLTGMKQLDGDKNLSSNFHEDFMMELRHAEERIHQNKRNVLSKQIVLIVTICFIALFSSYSISEYVVEEIINTSNRRKVSDFKIKNYYFRNRPSDINKYVDQNDRILQINRIRLARIKIHNEIMETNILNKSPFLNKKIMIPK